MSYQPRQEPDGSREDVLQERARALAQPVDAGAAQGRQMLGFVASGQHYLVPLVDVVEVVPGRPLARVPHGRPPLLGVATHRSSLLAVFSLDDTSAQHATPPWLVVFGTGTDRLGVAADELVGTEHLDDDAVVDTDQDELDGVPVTAVRRRDGAPVLDVELLLALDHFAVAHDTPAARALEHP